MARVRVVVRVANCAGVTAPRRARHVARQALTKPGVHGVPDLVLLSEVSPVSVAEVARHHAAGAYVVQRGRVGSPEAGVAVVSRLPMMARRPVTGSPATREGGGIRMRPILGVRLGRASAWSVHAPPARAPLARALYLARVRACRGLVGGDFNSPPRWMRGTYVRKYRGHGVLGLLIPRHWSASKATTVDIGSDHEAVDVLVRIPSRLLRRL